MLIRIKMKKLKKNMEYKTNKKQINNTKYKKK